MRPETLRLLRLRWLMEQMAKMPAQRPAELADSLNGARFNIEIIARGVKNESGHYCPTVCCVIGSALFDPWFNEQGLSYKPRYGYVIDLVGEAMHYEASELARFFGLRYSCYTRLVNHSGYLMPVTSITPAAVVRKIDFLLLSEHRHTVEPASPYPADWP